jgi:hypothetical protein
MGKIKACKGKKKGCLLVEIIPEPKIKPIKAAA